METLEAALQQHFGWSAFRSGQRAVVEAVLEGRDALAVLPTGGGKSLCYQLPALIRDGLVVVISPLVALMEDQVLQLQRRGIAAACLHAGLPPERRMQALAKLRDESLRLLYLAPERLQGEATRQMLESHAAEGRLVALAVDEAHCISAWGHDFRPDYRRLGQIRRLCPGVPMLALSATAAPRVRADIIRLLDLRSPMVQVSSARRTNLRYVMQRRPKDPMPLVLEALAASRGAALIYARTRRSVEQWAERLQQQEIPATPYHAGLDPVARHQALTDFLGQERPVLVATVAFGMGVDRADVGLVLHLDLPSTPEGYLQESGRAGRDGHPADCLVLFSPGDRTSLGWAMQASLRRGGDDAEQRRLDLAQQQLRRMEAVAEGGLCREQALLLSVGELSAPCGRCDRCTTPAKRKNWSRQAQTLLSHLVDQDGTDMRRLGDYLSLHEPGRSDRWTWLARRLVQDELIRESNDGLQRLYVRDSGRRYVDDPWPLDYSA